MPIRSSNALVLALLLTGLCLILSAVTYWLLIPPPLVTGLIRTDCVSGPGNQQYRRVVEVRRAAGIITTTVKFTELAKGGVGSATFIQPDRPLRPRWKLLLRRWRPMFPLPGDGRDEVPLMVIPSPIKPGGRWIVRFQVGKNLAGIEGRGKAPPDAVIDLVPSSANPGYNAMIDRDGTIVYGERIEL